MKRNIIAIGGGRIMVPKGQNPQTLAIDKEILRLCHRKKPRFLFFPTASLDDEAYCERIKNHFGEKLGCRVETLLLYRQRPNAKVIKNKILNAGIIYVGGGNTLRMMNLWRQLGIDRLVNKARKKDASCPDQVPVASAGFVRATVIQESTQTKTTTL